MRENPSSKGPRANLSSIERDKSPAVDDKLAGTTFSQPFVSLG